MLHNMVFLLYYVRMGQCCSIGQRSYSAGPAAMQLQLAAHVSYTKPN